MKNLFTILIICITTLSFAQQVTIGSQGTGVYFSSNENVYVTSIKLKFKDDVQLVRTSAFENLYVPLLIDPNDFSLTWSQGSGTGENAIQMLIYADVRASFKPTNNEFKKFYEFAAENTLEEIVEVTGFISEDGSIPPPDNVTTLSTNLDNTLAIENVVFNQIQPYPNPFNSIINISGLKESMLATVYDITGREVFRSQVTPSKNTLDVSVLRSSLYVLNIDNGENSKGFTILKK